MARTFAVGVFIARCQPPHKAHLAVLEAALREADQVLVLLGSSFQPATPKNPWSFAERRQMLEACFGPEDLRRLAFRPLRDHLYSDPAWVVEVQRILAEFTAERGLAPEEWPGRVALFGHGKERSTAYLGMFPQLDRVETGWDPEIGRTSATEVRAAYFEGRSDHWGWLPRQVAAWLERFQATRAFLDLAEEHQYLTGYHDAWSRTPHPPTFVTADAVVLQSGHVLMIRRRGWPGRGLLALPGGFVEPGETLLEAALRELREETGIGLEEAVLRRALTGQAVFDHPDRSLRGRTISQAYAFELPEAAGGLLPRLRAGSDAERAQWICLRDLLERSDRIFEDHAEIVLHFAHLS